MSVLETPRIYFKGEVSWDPITTNNYDTNYDESKGDTIYPQAVNKVKAFRAQSIAQVVPGSWNPHGTHRVTFYNTAVCGFDVGAGLATEAATAVLHDGFHRLGLSELIAVIHPENERSRRVATKLGMRPECQLHNPVLGREVDIWQTTPGAGRAALSPIARRPPSDELRERRVHGHSP